MLTRWLVAQENLSVGVDLGGTKTEVVLLRSWSGRARYEVLERERVATPQQAGYQAILETTATLKLKKGPLREAGFDPARSPDPIFVRDDARRAFVPLGSAEAAGLRSGALRL